MGSLGASLGPSWAFEASLRCLRASFGPPGAYFGPRLAFFAPPRPPRTSTKLPGTVFEMSLGFLAPLWAPPVSSSGSQGTWPQGSRDLEPLGLNRPGGMGEAQMNYCC